MFSAMFYGGLVLSILFLIASVVIFFLMDIPHAFGIVTGRTQKKAIEEIRAGGKAQVSKRRRVKESDILARDVSATSGSGIMRGKKSSSKSDNIIAQKAAEDAKKAVEAANAAAAAVAANEAAKAAASKAGQKPNSGNVNLANTEEAPTDILTYNEMKNKGKKVPTGEEATSVLEEEQSTDVLRYGENSETVPTPKKPASQQNKTAENAIDVEAPTDLLRNKPTKIDIPESDVTDVLTSPDSSQGLAGGDIYGTYNPELTAVLKADMTPGADSVIRRAEVRELPGITVIYSETVVHTDESL